MKVEKYTIGQMAEKCNVSKKILRFYDTNGILKPAYRDDGNSYRYYTEDQIEEVLLLQELRDLNFSVKEIEAIFCNRNLNTFEEKLENHLHTLRQKIDALQVLQDRTLELFLRVAKGSVCLEKSEKTGEEKIQCVRFHKRTVFYTRYHSFWNAKKLFLSRRAELLKLVSMNNYEPYGPNMAVFHSGYLQQFSDKKEDECGDLEVFVEVKNGRTGENCRVIEEFDAVSGIFVGPYANMQSFYNEMEEYARKRQIELENVSIEEYLIGATMTDHPNDYVTRIYIPFKGQFH